MNFKTLNEIQDICIKSDIIDAGFIVAMCDIDNDFDDIRKWAISKGYCTETEWKKAVIEAYRRRKIIASLGSIPDTATQFIDIYAQKIQLHRDMSGLLLRRNSTSGAVEDATMSKITREIQMLNVELKLGFAREYVKDSAENWIDAMSSAARDEIKRKLAFDAGAEFDWAAFVHAAFVISADHPSELLESVIKKFFYDVKRKLDFLPVDNHLMMIWFGEQGCGKSTAMRLMFGPAGPLHRAVNFSDITDPRQMELWSTPILFLDEMGKAASADMECVKAAITNPTISVRPMYSNGIERVRQAATFCGASNKVLAQLIMDTTGTRRFFEMEFRKDADWAAINAFDFGAAWKSIDEKAADPIIPFLPQIQALQNDQRRRSTVEEWLEHVNHDAVGLEYIYEITLDRVVTKEEFHAFYREWREKNHQKAQYTLDLQDFFFEINRILKSKDRGLVIFKRKKTNKFNGWEYCGKSDWPKETVDEMIARCRARNRSKEDDNVLTFARA